MDEINEVREGEEANFQKALDVLGDSVSLVQDLLDLYSLIAQIIERSGVGPRDDVVLGAQFLLGCRYQLTLAALAVLRGHFSDSFYFSRKAIELCAFAARVKKHPHLARVWVLAADSQASHSEYREKFSPGKLFPEDHEVLGKLGERYDLCCKKTHPSIYSLGGHVQAQETESKFRLTFDYFELKDKDRSEPARSLLWLLDTHFGILRIFEEVLADAIAHDHKKWEIRRNAADARISLHKGKWKSVILPLE